jgi:hypothetical protein
VCDTKISEEKTSSNNSVLSKNIDTNWQLKKKLTFLTPKEVIIASRISKTINCTLSEPIVWILRISITNREELQIQKKRKISSLKS